MPLCVRGAQSHLEPSFGPQLQDAISMEFGTARLHVDEISPREDMNAT